MTVRKPGLAVALAACALASGAAGAAAHDDDRKGGRAIDTRADYSPLERFSPLAVSSPCTGAPGGRGAQPFVLPPGYRQQVLAEETDTIGAPPNAGPSEDLWDMNTQNEFGKDAGRYVFRTHEVASAPAGSPPRAPGGAAVTVTDLKTGLTKTVAERNDWERFDGIAWTPWGTILAAEETIVQSARDPQVPQARGGLVYELFVDPDDPSKLAPWRERITPGDGTTDTTRDGIRARPALGAKSHEGMRFDARGFHYGISETRGQTTAGQAGAVFRFVPDTKGDLSKGRLYALQTPNRRYGYGRWVLLDHQAAQVDADAEAERQGANEYQRPEDVETGESTGRDRNNHGHTVYVAITEGSENGVLAIDVRRPDRPLAYQYAGPAAGNASNPDFINADNLALDRDGNLAISEDPAANPVGADIWIAAPPRRGRGGDWDYADVAVPARTVRRFASLKDCVAEPTGIYFALAGTERWTSSRSTVNGSTLFVNRQHSGQGTTADQLVAIAPEYRKGHHDHDDDKDSNDRRPDKDRD